MGGFLTAQLKQMGFVRGKASPCCVRHTTRDLRCIFHGDDFVFVGPEAELRWAKTRMEASFLVKVMPTRGRFW